MFISLQKYLHLSPAKLILLIEKYCRKQFWNCHVRLACKIKQRDKEIITHPSWQTSARFLSVLMNAPACDCTPRCGKLRWAMSVTLTPATHRCHSPCLPPAAPSLPPAGERLWGPGQAPRARSPGCCPRHWHRAGDGCSHTAHTWAVRPCWRPVPALVPCLEGHSNNGSGSSMCCAPVHTRKHRPAFQWVHDTAQPAVGEGFNVDQICLDVNYYSLFLFFFKAKKVVQGSMFPKHTCYPEFWHRTLYRTIKHS